MRPSPANLRPTMARILLIDDDADMRGMLRETLAHFGHTVIEACDGKEGLDLFPRAAADLVITDIVMPEKEGIAVMLELRKKRPPVKIIAISGGGRGSAAHYLHIAKQLGAARILAKPFPNETLMAAVDEVLAGAGRAKG